MEFRTSKKAQHLADAYGTTTNNIDDVELLVTGIADLLEGHHDENKAVALLHVLNRVHKDTEGQANSDNYGGLEEEHSSHCMTGRTHGHSEHKTSTTQQQIPFPPSACAGSSAMVSRDRR